MTTALPLLCNEWNTPYTYQCLADWQNYVAAITNVYQLNSASQQLSKGNQGHAHVHPFRYGTADWDNAWKALFDRGRALGCYWDKYGKRFRERTKS